MATRKTDTKLLQLLASALDTEFTNGDETECFQLDIKSLLPLKTVRRAVSWRPHRRTIDWQQCGVPPRHLKKPKRYVVDMLGTSLRLRTMEEFIRTKGFPELAVIRYSNDTLSARDRSASLALRTLHELHDCTGLYHLLGDNCNNFATWCRTMRWETADVAAAGAQAYAATCRLQPLKTPQSKTLFLGCAPMHS